MNVTARGRTTAMRRCPAERSPSRSAARGTPEITNI